MAELEILNWLVGFFCPTSEAASTCNEFISSHSNVLPPIGPIFYFLLFPAVFTILFIMVLMDSVKVAQGKKGMHVLLGVTAFIFIIISGWYPIMLILSEFWYIIIILFGFWWFLTGHFRKGGGGGGGGGGKLSALGLGGAMGTLMTKKQEHDELKLAESSLNMAEGRLHAIEEGKEPRPADAMQQVEDSLTSATGAINRLLLDPVHSSKALGVEKRKNEVLKEMDRVRKKKHMVV